MGKSLSYSTVTISTFPYRFHLSFCQLLHCPLSKSLVPNHLHHQVFNVICKSSATFGLMVYLTSPLATFAPLNFNPGLMAKPYSHYKQTGILNSTSNMQTNTDNPTLTTTSYHSGVHIFFLLWLILRSKLDLEFL